MNGYHSTNGGWQLKEAVVIGTGGADQLTFRESNIVADSNGVGALLDDIRMIEI